MLSILIIPGLIGGVILALFLARFRPASHAPARREPEGRPGLEPPTPGLINMARIRVDGLGGLGLVAMAIVVAVFVPRIRVEMIAALILGILLAAVLIGLRRRRGPLTSTSDHPGAHTMFELDTRSRPSGFDTNRGDAGRSERLAVVHSR
jgi:hypothetical protein